MHELSIALSMIDAAEEEAANRASCPPIALYVKIGALSGVAPEALWAAYDLAREHTTLSDCRLVIEHSTGPELLLSALEFPALEFKE